MRNPALKLHNLGSHPAAARARVSRESVLGSEGEGRMRRAGCKERGSQLGRRMEEGRAEGGAAAGTALARPARCQRPQRPEGGGKEGSRGRHPGLAPDSGKRPRARASAWESAALAIRAIHPPRVPAMHPLPPLPWRFRVAAPPRGASLCSAPASRPPGCPSVPGMEKAGRAARRRPVDSA